MTTTYNTFDYSVWTAGSAVTLANVAWDNSYRDVVYYDTDERAISDITQNGYTVTLDKLTLLPQGEPITLNIPFSEVNRFNYLVAQNPTLPTLQSNTPTVFFYFITSVQYLAPNTTVLHLQLDVFQTYSRRFEFGRAFVERGHIGISAENAYEDFGSKYLTTPEGIDTGAEYINTHYDSIDFINGGGDIKGTAPIVIVTSTIAIDGNWGDVKNPKINTPKPSEVEGLPNATAMYVCSLNDYIVGMPKIPTWVAQGITSVMLTSADVLKKYRYERGEHTDQIKGWYKLIRGSIDVEKTEVMTNDMRHGTQFLLDSFEGGRYKRLKKFHTSPYSMVELTTFSGSPIYIKPETVNTHALILTRLTHMAPPNPRVVWVVNSLNDYKGMVFRKRGIKETLIGYDMGDTLNRQVGFLNLPTFNVLNDRSMAYQANNAHSISFGYSNADWSQQKALQGAQNSYDVSKAGINTQNTLSQMGREQATANTNLANSFANQMSVWNGVQSIAGGLASGGVVGGGAGVVGGLTNFVTTQMQNDQRTAQTNLNNSFSARANNLSISQANYANDTNYSYAQWATRGDYAQTIAGMNAKIQDTQLTPPSVVGQAGGDVSTYVFTGKWSLYAYHKMIPLGSIRFIGEYWLRYGYAMNVFTEIPKNFQVMNRFTYWKLSNTTIKRADCPESFKQVMRGIFEKGVTVWAHQNDIATIDVVDNEPLEGVWL